jgi:Protein of unknown function (DUF1501)
MAQFKVHTVSRRDWFRSTSCGFGSLALASLFTEECARAASPRSIARHFPAKANRFIFIYLQGAPSHLDTFDYKPKLIHDHDKLVAPDGDDIGKYVGTPFKFERRGASGQWISELYPHLSTHADKLCFVKSMTTDVPNHSQAVLQMHTGSFRFPRPSVGAWMTYGLGSEAEDLPGFLVLNPVQRDGGVQNYGSAFLPSRYQATRIGAEGQPISSARLGALTNSRWDEAGQRRQLDLLSDLDRDRPNATASDAELNEVIRSYELAFQMQHALPRLMDLGRESRATLDLYGVGVKPTDDFGRQCLIARRAVESGVRFVEITSVGWDHHRDLKKRMTDSCAAIDRPVAGLLSDLSARGLLEDTVVLFGGEFGRTPMSRGGNGRDHQSDGFTMWLAGGGVRGGMSYGATDDHGMTVAENKAHIHDLNATLLHLGGLDHTRLTYRYSGRDFRLTDVYGEVLTDILA